MTAKELGTRGPAWMVQAAEIARLFYLEGRSKVEIGEALGLSRFKVARILDDALELGLVEVRINLPVRVDATLSSRLRQRFGLRRALVVEGSSQVSTAGPVHEHVCRVAAELLGELVTETDVLGLTCSRNVAATTDALTRLAPCRVIQLTGTLAGAEIGPGSVESVRRAAQVGGGKAFPIYAPMVLGDASTARSLANQSGIRPVLEQFPDVTIAMVSVGAWRQGASSVWQTVDERLRSEALEAGAVGEIGARLFDASGQPLPTPLDERVLGMTLKELSQIDEVIALGFGRERREAIRAALTGGLVTTLVSDGDLAEALLDET